MYAGYYWSTDGKNPKRWGTAHIQGYVASVDYGRGPTNIGWTVFDPWGGNNAMVAADGDSGGGVFYKNGGTWQLAGIMLAVATYSDQPVNAAVFGDETYFADLSTYSSQIAGIMAAPQTLYWSGTGAWNQTTANWSRVSGGPYPLTWAMANAVFSGTAGTVNVAQTIGSVNSIAFTTDSYLLTGTGAITLTGTGGNITTRRRDRIDCTIAGSVGLTKNGGGTLILSGTNTYTGGTTISAGTLQIGNGGTTGSIVGNVNNGGILAFNRSDAPATPFVFGGNISGNGGVTQMGTGKVVLTGTNTYNGVTTISGGTLQIDGASPSTNVLTNAGGANVTGGKLVLDYTTGTDPKDTIRLLLHTAFNGGVNPFQSGQIFDTSATSNYQAASAVGLGYWDNATTHQVTIMPAVYGDCDGNGQVTSTDLTTLLSNYLATNVGWAGGDFTYSGQVTSTDLTLLLNNYLATGPVSLNIATELPNQVIEMLSTRDISVTTVPEPSSLIMLASLLALGGVWGIGRRRNRR